MKRALIIANSVSYGDTSKNLPRSVIANIARDVSARLTTLEEDFRYKVMVIEDETRVKAREQIRRAIKAIGDAEESLLFYYFGHGFQPDSDDDLYLFFKNSDPYDRGTMIKFGDIVDWLQQYGVPEVTCVMDCCHAGMVSRHLRLLDKYDRQFFLMASVNAAGKALVDYGDEQPIGLFTRYFLQAFNSVGARAQGREVTFSSFFEHIKTQMNRTSKQDPYSLHVGLADKIFFRQATRPVILPELNHGTPKKCIYKKLFTIAEALLKKDFRSPDALYRFLEARNAPEFLQPVKRADGAVEYHFVKAASFWSYISLAREVGILEREDPLRLTHAGKRMVRSSGSQFNAVLFVLVQITWNRYGLRLEDLEDAIAQRLKSSAVPSGDAIYRDILLSKRLFMPKGLFKAVLDLTAYVGALDYSKTKTYFLSTAEETDQDQS